MAEAKARAVADLGFEEALAELETVVGRLESGDVPLEQSIELYARGAELRAHCDGKLKEAEARVSQIAKSADGRISAKEVDVS